jgi:hypothetical protein
MKFNLPKLLALCALSAQGLIAAPLFTIGDNLDVFFNGGIEGRYQTNLFLTQTAKESDSTLIVSPGVEARYGRGGSMGISVTFREDVYFYNKNTDLNTQNANLFVSTYYDAGGKIKGNAGFSFVQVDQNDADLDLGGLSVARRSLVSRNLYNLPIEVTYDFSPKTYFDGGFIWSGTHYTSFRRTYEDQYTYTIPVNVLWRYSPKLDLGVGYQFRYTDMKSPDSPHDFPGLHANDRYDHFFYGTLRGELTAKIEARARLGVNYQDMSKKPTFGNQSDTTMGFDGSLLYQFSQKLNFDAGVNRDFSAGSVGQSILNTGGNVGVRYDYSDYISAGAGLNYNNADYKSSFDRGRKDDTYDGRVNVSYRPNQYWAFVAGVTIQYNDSNRTGLSYQNNIYSLAVNLRY